MIPVTLLIYTESIMTIAHLFGDCDSQLTCDYTVTQ